MRQAPSSSTITNGLQRARALAAAGNTTDAERAAGHAESIAATITGDFQRVPVMIARAVHRHAVEPRLSRTYSARAVSIATSTHSAKSSR